MVCKDSFYPWIRLARKSEYTCYEHRGSSSRQLNAFAEPEPCTQHGVRSPAPVLLKCVGLKSGFEFRRGAEKSRDGLVPTGLKRINGPHIRWVLVRISYTFEFTNLVVWLHIGISSPSVQKRLSDRDRRPRCLAPSPGGVVGDGRPARAGR